MPKSRRLKSRRSSRRIKHRKSTKKYRKHRRHRSRVNRGIKKVYMKGGYGPGAGPLGSSWGPNPSTWPNGGSGNNSMGNHYPQSPYGMAVGGQDPAIPSNNLANLRSQSGGGFPFTQDFVNMGRSAMYGASKFLSDLGGSANPEVDPDVTQQGIDERYKTISYNPPNVAQNRIDADNYVSQIY